MVALALGAEPLATMWGPKGTPDYPQKIAVRPVELLRNKVEKRSNGEFKREAWDKLVSDSQFNTDKFVNSPLVLAADIAPQPHPIQGNVGPLVHRGRQKGA